MTDKDTYFWMKRGWWKDEIFPKPEKEPYCRRAAWVWLVDHAHWSDEPKEEATTTKELVLLQRGELLSSERYLAQAWGWTPSKVRRWIAVLQKQRKIEARTEAGQTIITLCNYDKIQGAVLKKVQVAEQTRSRPGANIKHITHSSSSLRSEGDGAENNSDIDLFGQVPSKWAFEGKFIKVQKKEFDEWLKIFHAVPDLQSELYSLDVWLQEPHNKEKIGGWKRITVNSLQRKHNEHLQLQKQAQAKEAVAEEVGFREYDPNNPLPRPAPRTNRGRT